MVKGMTDTTMIDRLKQFVESEMRSCSMDIGGITPLYVYRMWGGAVAIENIATAMEEVRIIQLLYLLWLRSVSPNICLLLCKNRL